MINVDQGLAMMVCFYQPFLLDILYSFETVKGDKYSRTADYTRPSNED